MDNQENPDPNQQPYNVYNNYSDPQEWIYTAPGNNSHSGEAYQWESPAEIPPPPPPSFENAYPPTNPYSSTDYASQPSQEMSGYQYPGYPGVPAWTPPAKTRNRTWPCFVVVLVVLLLMGGGLIGGGIYIFNTFHSNIQSPIGSGSGSDGGNGNGITSLTVTAEPSIKIDRNTGPIRVRVGSDSQTVTIQAIDDTSKKPVTQAIPYTRSNQGQTITFMVDNFEIDDLELAVPERTNLDLATNDGDITVVGVHGQMTLKSNAGTINISQAIVTAGSIFDTNGGSIKATEVKLAGSASFTINGGDIITFTGSLDPSGTYKFDSNGGPIDITLSASSAFHVDATSDTSSITTTFPTVQVKNDTVGSQAHGDVGKPPRATLTVTTTTGSIKLLKGA